MGRTNRGINNKPNRIKAVIFDLDGTLIETEQLGFNCFKEASLRLGFNFPDSLYLSMAGLTERDSDELLRRTIPDISVKQLDMLKNIYDEIYMKSILNSIPLCPGALIALRFVKNSGLRCGLATSSSQKVMNHKVKRTNIEKFFDCICTDDDVIHGKPAPEIFNKVIDRLGLDPSECLAVEDSEPGILSAAEAGLTTVLVHGIAPIRPDVQSCIFARISTLHELPDLICDLNNNY